MPAPKAVAKASSDDTADNDTVGSFLGKHSQSSKIGWPKDDCYRQYVEYCNEHGRLAVDGPKFVSTMKAKQFVTGRKKCKKWNRGDKKIAFYKGIMWRDDDEDDDADTASATKEEE